MTNDVQNFAQQEDEGFKLEDFGMVLLANWYWIVLAVAIALSVAVVTILRTTPLYTRSSSLLIKSEDKNGGASSLAQDFQQMRIFANNSNINNEILTISAPVLMQETVRRLRLDVQMDVREGLHDVPLYDQSPVRVFFPQASDEFMGSFKMQLKKDRTVEMWDFRSEDETYEKRISGRVGTLVRTPIGMVLVQPTEYWNKNFVKDEISVHKYPVESIGNMYAGRLSVALSDKESTILNLSLSDESKQRADDILLKLVEVYNEQWLKDKNRVAESTFQFITERLNTLAGELGDVDQKISDYKSKALLPDVDAASQMYMTESVKNSDQILTLSSQRSIAQYIKEYLGDRSKQGQYLPTNTGIGSTGIENMIAEYNKLISQRNDLLQNSSESNPIVQKVNAELSLQRSTILHSLDNLIAQLSSQLKTWESSEAQTNQKLATAPRQVKQLLTVGRQQKVKEALYIFLLQKREENELSRTFTTWNTRIIQPPMGSPAPSSPRKSMILLVAFAMGLLVPAGILFLRETLNHSVRGRADLDGMNVPLLGEIPALAKRVHWWTSSKSSVPCEVYIKENSRDLINESFRMLRTNLDYFMRSVSEPAAKVVMVTSFNPGSGKSFISLNLTTVLSLRARALLIDLDFRHCSASQVAGRPKHGLTDYLAGLNDDIDSLILKDALGRGGDLLPVGVIPPNPTELLMSERLAVIIKKLRDEYDYIILDCPPTDLMADTSIVKQYAEVSLFVVRAGLMDRRLLKDVDQLYNENTYNHMAVLLNGTKYVSSRYSNYRYGYAYGYHYGHHYGEPKS